MIDKYYSRDLKGARDVIDLSGPHGREKLLAV